MNPATFAIQNRVLTLTLTVLMLVGGLQTFQNLPRLEDPEFTIKDALVITPYPGASATEVEEEVTDELEIAVQQMGQLDEVSSKSDRGLSTLTVTIKSNYSSEELPQVWDELRRKVGDAQSKLPPGAGPSIVVDDYGDVYGVFVAIYGSEYSYAELKQYVDRRRCGKDRHTWRARRIHLRRAFSRSHGATRNFCSGHRRRTATEELGGRRRSRDGGPRVHRHRALGQCHDDRATRRNPAARRKSTDLPARCRERAPRLRRPARPHDPLRRQQCDRPGDLDHQGRQCREDGASPAQTH
ncbi:MAG: efflux RND transporter permease subunit, partial [Deltaproteobacteria bacterium]|nr:efflux RND transporter permease subunit [Deltaproteobacteria bacterium]